MEEFKTISLAEQVYKKLEKDIVSGFYKKGEIITELQLSKKLNVSRTPIREALSKLQTEHLIKETGKGNVILGITLSELEDIMDIREKIEGFASYYCALNCTDEERNKLKEISDLQGFYFKKKDTKNLGILDNDIHCFIYKNCKKPIYQDVLTPLHIKTQRYRIASLTKRKEKPINEHNKICKAIINKDAENAKKFTEQHIRNAKKSMIERFKNNG